MEFKNLLSSHIALYKQYLNLDHLTKKEDRSPKLTCESDNKKDFKSCSGQSDNETHRILAWAQGQSKH